MRCCYSVSFRSIIESRMDPLVRPPQISNVWTYVSSVLPQSQISDPCPARQLSQVLGWDPFVKLMWYILSLISCNSSEYQNPLDSWLDTETAFGEVLQLLMHDKVHDNLSFYYRDRRKKDRHHCLFCETILSFNISDESFRLDLNYSSLLSRYIPLTSIPATSNLLVLSAAVFSSN